MLSLRVTQFLRAKRLRHNWRTPRELMPPFGPPSRYASRKKQYSRDLETRRRETKLKMLRLADRERATAILYPSEAAGPTTHSPVPIMKLPPPGQTLISTAPCQTGNEHKQTELYRSGGGRKLSKYTKRKGSAPLPTAAAEKGAVGRAHAHNSIPQHTFKKKPKRRGGASRRIDLFFGCVALSFRPYLSPFLIFLSSTFFFLLY